MRGDLDPGPVERLLERLDSCVVDPRGQEERCEVLARRELDVLVAEVGHDAGKLEQWGAAEHVRVERDLHGLLLRVVSLGRFAAATSTSGSGSWRRWRARARPARGDDLGPRVEADALRAVNVLVAEQRVLPPAEGVVRHRHRDRHVDADHADVDAALESSGRLAAVGEDRRPVAIRIGVHQRDRLVDRVGAYDGEHRAEDLLGVDVHHGQPRR